MSETISLMETKLKFVPDVDSVSVLELLNSYQNFALKYPKDSLSPEYLYKAAALTNSIGRGTQTIELYETIIQNYPDFKKMPDCYFMEAFVYENVQGNIGKAAEKYAVFLEKFPEHPLADDALTALKFLGKTPDEILQEFEKLN
jgi:TolA-binding protein